MNDGPITAERLELLTCLARESSVEIAGGSDTDTDMGEEG